MKTWLPIILVVCATISIFCLSGCKGTLEETAEKGAIEQKSTTPEKPGTVIFNSIPLGVEVYLDGELRGQTPLTLQLEDGKKYKVEFKDEAHGYETETMEIDNKAGTISVSLRKKRD